MQYNERKRILFFGLPWTFTRYTISDEYITVNSGLINQKENDCYMYKIVDTRLESSLLERIFGLATIRCFSSDTTDPSFSLTHIRHAKEIKQFILEASEADRTRRRTLNTQDITGDVADGDL